MGVDIVFAFDSRPEDRTLVDRIDNGHLLIASGAGVALHIEGEVAVATSFPCVKNAGGWWQWCYGPPNGDGGAARKHQEVATFLAKSKYSGPWNWPGCPCWYLRLNGEAFVAGHGSHDQGPRL